MDSETVVPSGFGAIICKEEKLNICLQKYLKISCNFFFAYLFIHIDGFLIKRSKHDQKQIPPNYLTLFLLTENDGVIMMADKLTPI